MAKTPQWFDSAPLPKEVGTRKLKKALAKHGVTPWEYLEGCKGVVSVVVENAINDCETVDATFVMQGGETLNIRITETTKDQEAIVALVEVLARVSKLLGIPK